MSFHHVMADTNSVIYCFESRRHPQHCLKIGRSTDSRTHSNHARTPRIGARSSAWNAKKGANPDAASERCLLTGTGGGGRTSVKRSSRLLGPVDAKEVSRKATFGRPKWERMLKGGANPEATRERCVPTRNQDGGRTNAKRASRLLGLLNEKRWKRGARGALLTKRCIRSVGFTDVKRTQPALGLRIEQH